MFTARAANPAACAQSCLMPVPRLLSPDFRGFDQPSTPSHRCPPGRFPPPDPRNPGTSTRQALLLMAYRNRTIPESDKGVRRFVYNFSRGIAADPEKYGFDNEDAALLSHVRMS